jgi:DNA (cytosine-5)-methyltransferase 1
LFYNFIDVINEKKPKFFLAENVSGMLAPRHNEALSHIKNLFTKCGYTLSFKLLNSSDYGVPQDRKRVFFIGLRNDLGIKFKFPKPFINKVSLKESIWDLRKDPLPAKEKNKTNGKKCKIPNHEFLTGGFSTMFMSRNRVRSWNEQSFTIQAGGRHCPIHPQAPKMIKIEKNKQVFNPDYLSLYRRLTIREVARIQTYPDDFIFYYKSLTDGYKMIGNSVPVQLSRTLGQSLYNQINTNQIKSYNLPPLKTISNV